MCPTSDSSMGPNGPGSSGGAGGPPMGGPSGSNGGPPPPENIENIKTSPSNGPGTPREDSGGAGMNEFMPPDYGNSGENVSNELFLWKHTIHI